MRITVDKISLEQTFLRVLRFLPLSMFATTLHAHSLIHRRRRIISATDSAVTQYIYKNNPFTFRLSQSRDIYLLPFCLSTRAFTLHRF